MFVHTQRYDASVKTIQRWTVSTQRVLSLINISVLFWIWISCTSFAQQPEDQPDGPALSPSDALASFNVKSSMQWSLILSEPECRQPVMATFDTRGRLWVVQYLQYPEPAGIKAISRDNYWRVVYDRLPEPLEREFPVRIRLVSFNLPAIRIRLRQTSSVGSTLLRPFATRSRWGVGF